MTFIPNPPGAEAGSQVGLFLWGPRDGHLPSRIVTAFMRGRRLVDLELLLPDAKGRLRPTPRTGYWLPVGAAASLLATVPLSLLPRLSPSVAVWALAAKWAIELVMHQQVVFQIAAVDAAAGLCEARWRAAPVRPEDEARLEALAAFMPGVARARAILDDGDSKDDVEVLVAKGVIQAFVDNAVDGLIRAPTDALAPPPAPPRAPGPAIDWCTRAARALAGPDRRFQLKGAIESHIPARVTSWVQSVVFALHSGHPRVAFRLTEPSSQKGVWLLSFHLIVPGSREVVPATELQQPTPRGRELLAQMRRPREALLVALDRASNRFSPLKRALKHEHMAFQLSPAEAWQFITTAHEQLGPLGHPIEIPAALTRAGQRRVRARVRVSMGGDAPQSAGLLGSVINYRWEASLGEDALTEKEFRELVKHKSPLVYHRGHWVALDPADVERLQKRFGDSDVSLDPAEALRMALVGEAVIDGGEGALSVPVVGDASVMEALRRLRESASSEASSFVLPKGLGVTLRHYQERGVTWLRTVTDLGFGACLADDMGLGKTIQLLTLLATLSSEAPARFIVVCPTSVLGNWRREIGRFFPDFRVVLHHGAGRADTPEALRRRLGVARAGAPVVMLTSYALARRDNELLAAEIFDALVLDEAQNIKNPEAAQTQAVRLLQARRRIALTGTPVENRLLELWSIMDFLNPGLLGSQGAFKKQFSTPIERYGDAEATEALRRVTAPFILRRMKTDPEIAPDLPEKITSTRFCPLTREQAALYQAVAESALQEISSLGRGADRQGRILSMLTAIKQICNHPAHYLRDGDLSPRRSGKLVRFLQLIDEIRDNDGVALVFTQYREMGDILQRVLSERLGDHVPFLHGSLTRQVRDQMVADFQSGDGPPVFIVSLRAGGTGLNLTRANHVLHFDRWWNPAVEDQASDRAYRIGQTRNVNVHEMVCQDTLEERTHNMLKQKRLLADQVVGEGETWLTALDDDTLRSIILLGEDAVLED